MARRSLSDSPWREAGRDDGDLHRLLLEQRHARGSCQRTSSSSWRGRYWRTRVDLGAVAAAQIGMHHVALDGAGPHDRDLDDEVVEFLRLEARQHGHLRPALDLEHADASPRATASRRLRVRPAGRSASVSSCRRGCSIRSKLLRDGGSACRAPSTSTFSSRSASISSLSHSMKVRSSMAPLRMGTVSSRRPRVSTKPPTCCERWRGKPMSSEASPMAWRMSRDWRDRGRPRGCACRECRRCSMPHTVLGECRRHVLLETQRLADLADGHARAIVDDGRRRWRRACAAVALIKMLDHLLRAARARNRRRYRAARCARARGSAANRSVEFRRDRWR